MNKRLLLALYDRSGLGAYMPVDYKGHELEVAQHMEKFAELIIKECAQVASDSNQSKSRAVGVNVSDVILNHFRVNQ